MDAIDTAVAEWHRIYGQLSAARERLRRAQAHVAADVGELARAVDALQAGEERALRAVRDALISARRRGARVPERPSWLDTEPA